MNPESLTCRSCGFENPSGFSFCGKCGSALVGVDEKITKTAIEAAPSQLKEKMKTESRKIKGERRRVVVMFADISGYTELSRDRDPEELKELVNGAILKLSDVAYRYEGYIDKIMGDCLMVLFGAPIAHEDDSERAVMAAFDLLSTIKEYGREREARLNLSVGIARGLCYAGEYGRPGDYTVIGEDVNLAERLQKIASPGTVYVSREVHELTSSHINYVKVGKKILKGIGEREVFEAVSMRYAEKDERPFVGRSREIERLKGLFEKTNNSQGKTCFVTGERGIGKSRVYQKFKREILDSSDIFFGQARGLEYLRGEFYYVLRGVLRHVIGIEEGLTVQDSNARLADFYAGRAELLYSLPFVKYLLSLPLVEKELVAIEGISPEEREKNIEGIIASTLLRLSDEKPLVIVVEDAQRMDKGSEKFFISLQRKIKNSRILIIMLCWEPLAGFYKKSANIKMKPLSQVDIRDLLKLNFDAKPISSRLLSVVTKMTKGNPLFIEETIELLKQEELVKTGRSVDLKTEKIQVPDKVYNIVLARIDRIGKRAKDTLKTASVTGFEFSDYLVSRIMERDELAVEFSELEGKDFIRFLIEANYQFGQARIYAFKNEIVRDVVYELILKEERRNLHKAAAQVAEKLYADNIDEYTDTIAYHYLEASDERAAPYLLKSAERKMRGYQLNDAIVAFEKYLKLKEDLGLPDDLQVFLDIAHAYALKAKYDEAFQCLETAEKLASDDESKGKVSVMQGRILMKLGKADEALTRMQKAERHLNTDNDVKCENYDNIGRLYIEKGEYDKAVSYLEKSLENRLHRLSSDHIDTGTSYNLLGNALRIRGELDKALDYFNKALEIHISVLGKDHPVTAKTYVDISGLYWRRGDYDTSIEYLKQALQIRLRVFGSEHPDTAGVYSRLGTNYLYKADSRNALVNLKKALRIQQQVLGADNPETANSYFNIGGVYWKTLDFVKALEYVNRAVSIWESVFGEKHPRTLSGYNGLAILYFNLGYYEEALGNFKKALDIRISLLGKDDPQTATSRYNLGCMYFDLGDYGKAMKHFSEGLRIQAKLFGDKHRETLLSCISVGQVLIRQGEYQKAIEYLEKAGDGFTETMGPAKNLTIKALTNLANAYTKANRDEDASKCTEQAFSVIEESIGVPGKRDVGFAFIPYLVEKGRLDEAEGILAEVRKVLVKSKDRLKRLEFLQYLVRVNEARGNATKVLEYVNQTLELARSIGLKPRLVNSLILAARITKDTKLKSEALSLARQIGDKCSEEEILNTLP